MAEMYNKPEIRFTGFTDAWEQREFSSTVTRISSVGVKSGLPRVEYEDIVSGRGELNKDIYQKESTKTGIEFDDGDILFGKLRPYLKNWLLADFKGIAVGDFWVFRTNETDNKFIYYLIQTSAYQTAANQSTGTKMPRSDWNVVSKTDFNIPTNITEQTQISTFFKQLDNLITLHQRKYDKLVIVKKSMLEKMFPKAGANVPELRFAGSTNAWGQRKFSGMYEKVSEKNDLSYGTDRIISVANMYFKADAYISDEEYLRTYNILKLGDIAFEGNKSKNFAYGRFVENTIGDGIVSHVFDVFRPIIEYDLLFWKYAINNERLMQSVLIRCTKASTMMTNLVASDFLNEKFQFPCLEEQKRIGEFFDCLNNLITLNQRELEKLKNIKESMLERMFVWEG